MDRYFTTATRLVTCRDELLDSVEGLESLLLQTIYLVNAGNLRQAWFSARRASALAQFSGIDRTNCPIKLRQLDSATQISNDVVWLHIVYMERYLSLLLGMSTSIAGKRFSSEQSMTKTTHAERIEKAHCDIFERIIERNQSGRYHDFPVTQLIDSDLGQMAASFPAAWWKPLSLDPGVDETEMMSKIISAQWQIIHYSLLTILHLPYLLLNDPDLRFNHNKTTCAYSSRETLSRFINFRSIVDIVYCCRPADFCALTAALTLILVHLNSHRDSLRENHRHQRIGDMMLIDRALEIMDELTRINNDELSRETAKLTRRLRELEARSAEGGERYSSELASEKECSDGRGSDDAFYLKIPYFGTVKISRDGVHLSGDHAPAATPSKDSYMSFVPSETLSPVSFSLSSNPYSETGSRRMAPTIYQQPTDQSAHGMQHLPDTHLSNEQSSFATGATSVYLGLQDQVDWAMPDLMASREDWAFQGVDALFFGSVMNGCMPPE